jgi:RNA polymerase sigma-70 factor, ECF subfamily
MKQQTELAELPAAAVPPPDIPIADSVTVRAALPDTAISDAETVARVLGGDVALYEIIMRRYNRLLFRLARGVVRDDDEAHDVVQAAFVRAYYHLQQFRGPAGFKSWLGRIALNEALGRTRRTGPMLVAHTRMLTSTDDDALEPESAAAGRDLLRVLQTAIDRLPEDFRQVFMLRGVEQLSILETAETLALKPATVKTRFHRARRMLREALHRKLDDITHDAFPFGGRRCDAIVAAVLARITYQ